MAAGQRWRLRWLPVTVMMVTIFWLSHQPGDTIALPPVANIDKVLHSLLYATLGLATYFALSPGWKENHRLAAGMIVVLFCLVYGLSDEWHQSFIPGRCSSLGDVLADTLGGGVAVVVEQGWRRRLAARAGGAPA